MTRCRAAFSSSSHLLWCNRIPERIGKANPGAWTPVPVRQLGLLGGIEFAVSPGCEPLDRFLPDSSDERDVDRSGLVAPGVANIG